LTATCLGEILGTKWPSDSPRTTGPEPSFFKEIIKYGGMYSTELKELSSLNLQGHSCVQSPVGVLTTCEVHKCANAAHEDRDHDDDQDCVWHTNWINTNFMCAGLRVISFHCSTLQVLNQLTSRQEWGHNLSISFITSKAGFKVLASSRGQKKLPGPSCPLPS
jgi:hypothetical protein